jgi:hypothetical protein
MKKKHFRISILLLPILVISLVATVGQTLASTRGNHRDTNDSNLIINSGTGSLVYLNLPSSTATSTVPSHPSDLQLRSYHFDKSPMGPFDSILVYLWIPQRNSYNLAALIINAPNVQLFQDLWYKTFIWYNTTGITSNPNAFLNVIQVADKDLQIWTENVNQGHNDKKDSNDQNSGVFIVNFTKADGVKINLPFNLWTGSPLTAYGDMSFTLPPLTLKFRTIADSYTDSGTNSTLPSGYARQPIAEMRTPAWVEETIPLWLGATSPLEVSGHIDYHFSEVITPPLPKV